MSKKNTSAEQIVIEVMRHFGFRRNYQVAEYFDVTPQTLSGWIKSGEIPPKHLMKYTAEVLEPKKRNITFSGTQNIENNQSDKQLIKSHQFSWNRTKLIIKNNIIILTLLPFTLTVLMTFYVFIIADPVYTSVSKVLPISDDGNSSNSFTGVAAQLGINIPITIGGTVPWDEIYPEILKSSDLLGEILKERYNTIKYGEKPLIDILILENSFSKYKEKDQYNRSVIELRKMIKIIKDRLSPVVTLEVSGFEPLFSVELSNRLIEKSGQVQSQLKTNRVRQKRLFIEERLLTVSSEMKKMEKELRIFRENNRNISSSPSLTMRVQELGREIDLQNSLYVTLKTQYEKAKIDEIERDDMVQIIDGPNIPTKLTSPRRGVSILLTICFSIFLSIFIVYFIENYINIKEN